MLQSCCRGGAASLALVAALLAAASAAQAQHPSPGGSILNLLEVEGWLEVGSEVRGALSTADYLSSDDSFLDAWALEGQAGESVTIDLMSGSFDAVLLAVGPGFGETLRDDDGGGGCDARLILTFLEDGTFRIVASSVSSRQTGVYSISVMSDPEPVDDYRCGGINPRQFHELPTDGRMLSMGETMSGQLSGGQTVDNGRAVQAWTLQGMAGEAVSITLESSDFDAYLYVLGPGLGEVLEDDDAAGDLDSRIEFTFEESGTYLVVASALSSGDYGSYRLSVGESRIVNELEEIETEGREIDVGLTVTGTFGMDDARYEGRPVQAWALAGESGQTVVIDLISDEFDAYLYLVGPGIGSPRRDDDGGDGLNSQIEFTFPETGTYHVIASALSGGQGESYELSVR